MDIVGVADPAAVGGVKHLALEVNSGVMMEGFATQHPAGAVGEVQRGPCRRPWTLTLSQLRA